MIMNDFINKQPLFSIIVPAYNSGTFIKKCIESVLEQTYPDFELILVDDGSKDDTFDICNSYSKCDSRIRVVHQANGGHTSARNKGLKLSVGKYIVFLDSDDWLNTRTLEICREHIYSHEPDVIIFGIKNSTSATCFSVFQEDGYYSVGGTGESLWENLLMGADGKFTFPKSLSGKCFKREIIIESQLSIPNEILIGEDGAAFVGAMLKAHSACVIAGDERACYNCLIRSDSVSRSSDVDAFRRIEILLKYYKEMLPVESSVFPHQFDRYVVAQLYTATLLVMRSGGRRADLNSGLNDVLNDSVILCGLKNAKFTLKGYKFIIKQLILRHRLWWLAGWLDK